MIRPSAPVRSPRGGVRRALNRLIDWIAPPVVNMRQVRAQRAYQHHTQALQLRRDIRARHDLKGIRP